MLGSSSEKNIINRVKHHNRTFPWHLSSSLKMKSKSRFLFLGVTKSLWNRSIKFCTAMPSLDAENELKYQLNQEIWQPGEDYKVFHNFYLKERVFSMSKLPCLPRLSEQHGDALTVCSLGFLKGHLWKKIQQFTHNFLFSPTQLFWHRSYSSS